MFGKIAKPKRRAAGGARGSARESGAVRAKREREERALVRARSSATTQVARVFRGLRGRRQLLAQFFDNSTAGGGEGSASSGSPGSWNMETFFVASSLGGTLAAAVRSFLTSAHLRRVVPGGGDLPLPDQAALDAALPSLCPELTRGAAAYVSHIQRQGDDAARAGMRRQVGLLARELAAWLGRAFPPMGAIAAAPARVAPVQAAAAVAEALDALTAAPALRGLLKHVAADALGALAGLLATAGPPAGLVASLDAICSRALAPSVASSESPAIFRQVVLRALKVPGFVGRAQGTGGVEGGRRRGGRGGRGWEAKGCVVARSVRELPLLLRDGKWTEGGR